MTDNRRRHPAAWRHKDLTNHPNETGPEDSGKGGYPGDNELSGAEQDWPDVGCEGEATRHSGECSQVTVNDGVVQLCVTEDVLQERCYAIMRCHQYISDECTDPLALDFPLKDTGGLLDCFQEQV